MAFCREYVKDFNATQAAIRSGYSAKTAYSIGQENLKKPEIAAEVKELVEMKPEEVKAGLQEIARGNIADLMDLSTTGYTFSLMVRDETTGEMVPNPALKLVKKIKQKVTTILPKRDDGEEREIVETELELYSRHEALRDIGKMHGLFIDRTELSGPEGGAIPVDLYDAALKKVYGPGSAT
jgi:phage terminase small subunit